MQKTLATTLGFLLLSAVNAGAVSVGVTVETLISPITLIDSASGPFAIPGSAGTATATVTGSSAVSGTSPTAAPYNGVALSLRPYFAAYGGNVTITFSANQSDILLLWGSIDADNTINFFDSAFSTVVPIFTLTGETLHDSYDTTISYGSILGNGTRKVAFAFDGGTFDSIEFVSPSLAAALEFNFIGASAVPLPAVLPLFASGLGALSLLGWRRKRKVDRPPLTEPLAMLV